MPQNRFRATALLALLAACGDSGTSPPSSDGVHLEPVDSGYEFPVLLTAPRGDSSQYVVVERAGRVRLVHDGIRQDSAFLNITDLTDPATGEYGLYSLAFHPEYGTNRKVYVYYVNLAGDGELVEYRADATRTHIDRTTRRPVLTVPMDPATVLYGGYITFGRDGMLYAGIGDGHPNGVPNENAQDSTILPGKILRIDVDAGDPYAVPVDNPYVGRAGWRGEIWQLGLRNPWRWSFDDGTGALWLPDVGENRYEELNYLAGPVVGGNNFGWPFMEASACFSPMTGCEEAGLIVPVLQYNHGATCSVIGGRVYRGKAYPELRGVYFFGDFCGGWVRSVVPMGAAVSSALPALASPIINDNVTSFGEDGRGEVYVLMGSGRIYRIAGAG
jgi:glucose/arabinose dehydrogenase